MKTVVLAVEVGEGEDPKGILPGARVLLEAAHWEQPYTHRLHVEIPGELEALKRYHVTFADVVHDAPTCGWCKLPLRVGELLVLAPIGSRQNAYVHEFCVGKAVEHRDAAEPRVGY